MSLGLRSPGIRATWNDGPPATVSSHRRRVADDAAVTSSAGMRGKQGLVVRRPNHIGVFEFIALSRLRVAQLAEGCAPRVPGEHLKAVLAQMEVADGAVRRCCDAETTSS